MESISPYFFFKIKQTGTADDKSGIPDGWMGLDIGEQSRKQFSEVILRCKTILWNG